MHKNRLLAKGIVRCELCHIRCVVLSSLLAELSLPGPRRLRPFRFDSSSTWAPPFPELEQRKTGSGLAATVDRDASTNDFQFELTD